MFRLSQRLHYQGPSCVLRMLFSVLSCAVMSLKLLALAGVYPGICGSSGIVVNTLSSFYLFAVVVVMRDGTHDS